MIQSSEQGLGRKHLDACCRQFDGQWQPVESQADQGNGRCIVRRHVKIGLDGLRSLEEQVHRGNVWKRLCIGKLPGIGERQGWDDELLFATQAQHLATRNEKLEIGAGFQEFSKQRGSLDDLFKVIKNQEPLLVNLRKLEEFQERLSAALHEPQAVSDDRDDKVGIAQWAQVD